MEGGGLKIVFYMDIILYNAYLKYVHIYYDNLYSLGVINYKYKSKKKQPFTVFCQCAILKWFTYLENIINIKNTYIK